MKTTENISLAGYAFTIETDAYNELATYLSDIRDAFRSDANAEEITSDIEERIAELLREKCISGMVVNLMMVQDIKKRIGNPKQLAQEDAEPEVEDRPEVKEPQQEKKSWKNKRLYRNTDERVLGGVCAGLGTYFGIDKVLFRILFIVFSLIPIVSHFGNALHITIAPVPFIYLILWIAMPAARTDDQKREMKGKPKDLESYKAKDFDFGKEIKEVAESPAGQTIKRGGGIFLGILLLLIGLGGMVGSVVITSLPAIISHEIAEEIADEFEDYGTFNTEEQFVADLLSNETFWIFPAVIVGLMFIWFIYNGIMLIFDLKYPSWKPGLIIYIAWVISIFVFAGYVVKIAADAIGTFMIWDI